MTTDNPSISNTQLIQRRREFVAEARRNVKLKRQSQEPAISVCNWFSDQLDSLLIQTVDFQIAKAGLAKSDSAFCLAAVGGNGRRRPAPYSDVDVLLIIDPRAAPDVRDMLSAIVRSCWDTGLQLGHSIRTPTDVVRFAAEDVQFATSLVDMRFITGSRSLLEATQSQVVARVLREKTDRLIQRCVTARQEEWIARGNSVNQLEPDVKKSPGGLRDIHLLQWVTFARYGNSRLSELVTHREISDEELQALEKADEFLTAIRLDLHCARQLKQDVLTRDMQLMLASPQHGGTWNDSPQEQARAVEEFMHHYFSHTSRVSEIARRTTESPRRKSLLGRIRSAILPQRTSQGFLVEDGLISVTPDQLKSLESEPLRILDLFADSAEQRTPLSPELRQQLGLIVSRLPAEPSRDVSKRFRDVLRITDGLPDTLRQMYETGVLEWLIPPFEEIRCLIQFNQYHSFTVDEHTLKAMDEIVGFNKDDSPVGSAYRSVRHRATLHLALLMHDVGKGREGDHSIVGAELCDQVAVRLQMAENKKSMLRFLVLHHLVMPNLAFRRDISDSAVLVDFARLVGAPELLRMLYVLTVADIKAVGPDVWSDWKGELLADLYNRTMQILSGRPYNHLEQERLKFVRETVRASIVPVGTHNDDAQWPQWIEQQLDALPPFYLMTEDASRIARDLDMIQQLDQSEVKIEGEYDAETDTVSYRIFAPEKFQRGSFHKISGILSGLRMNILAAQICTTAESILVAAFRVTDNDFAGQVPKSRIEDVAVAICDVLTARKTVESVFRRSSLFRFSSGTSLVAPTRPLVTIDNDCSERFTVIDIFASDSQGLLYTLAHTLFHHKLEVHLARIATHIDQVVDVFYVVDENNQKLEDPDRIEKLREALLHEISELASG